MGLELIREIIEKSFRKIKEDFDKGQSKPTLAIRKKYNL